MIARLLALLIFLSACLGIGLELGTLMNGGMSVPHSVWVLLGYFTILTNGLAAVVFGSIALHGARFDHPGLVAAVTAAMALVGVIFALLLQGLRTLAGATAEANFLLHQLNPVLILLYWVFFVRKGTLSWRDPLLWTLYPLAYLVYALARGLAEGHYAYPFIDVAANGWAGVATNAVAIAIGFVAAGEVLVLIDRALGRR